MENLAQFVSSTRLFVTLIYFVIEDIKERKKKKMEGI